MRSPSDGENYYKMLRFYPELSSPASDVQIYGNIISAQHEI